MNHVVNLMYSTDNGGCSLLIVSLYSLLHTQDKTTFYNIYIAHNGISDDNINIIYEVSNEFPNHKITFVNCKSYEEQYHISDVTKHGLEISWPSPIFYWYLAPLFIEAKKIIYLDIDTIVKKDLWDFYSLDFKTTFAGVKDTYHIWKIHMIKNDKNNAPILGTLENYYHKYDNLSFDQYSKIINTGSFLINLEKLKKFDLKNIFRICNAQKIMDQDYLNIYMNDEITNIDTIYNFSLHLFGSKEQKISKEFTKIDAFALYQLPENKLYQIYESSYITHFSLRLKPYVFFDNQSISIIQKIGFDQYYNLVTSPTSFENYKAYGLLDADQKNSVERYNDWWSHIDVDGFPRRFEIIKDAFKHWGTYWYHLYAYIHNLTKK